MNYVVFKNVTIRVSDEEDAKNIWKKMKELSKTWKLLPISMDKKLIGLGFEAIDINIQVKEKYFEELSTILQTIELTDDFDVVI